MLLRLGSALAIAAAFALTAIVSAKPLSHDDLFFHMRTGEMVVRTGSVPTVDSFTHTVTGAPWTSHEWGFGLLVYAFYRIGGFPAAVWLMPVLLACTLLAIHLQMRRGLARERLALAAPLLAIGLAAAAPSCLVLRAALITSLGIALVALLLQRMREARRWYDVVALGLVFLVWANMHAGVVFGLFVVGLHCVQDVFDAWRVPAARRWTSLLRGAPRDRALLLLACSAITLLNPSGFELWTFPFRVNKLFFHSGLAYDMGQYRAPVPATYPFFFGLVGLCLLACLPLKRLGRALLDRAWPLVAQVLGLLFFLVMALRSNRFILDFVVFALPFCAVLWGGVIARTDSEVVPTEGRVRSAWLVPAALAAVLAVAAILRPTFPTRTLAAETPVRLADFLKREQIDGRMFNPENLGGYLGWRLRKPVYWDGRNDIFGPVAFEWAYKRGLLEIATRRGLDVLILNPKYYRKFGKELASHQREWAVVYWDNYTVLYVKRLPKFERLIERLEYKLVRPFAVPSNEEIARLVGQPELRRQVEAELARALAQSDDTGVAWYLRGRIALETGDARAAYAALRRAAAVADHDETFYHLARAARDLGKLDEARDWLDRSMQMKAVP